MKKIRVMYSDWDDQSLPDLMKGNNIFTEILNMKYDVEIVTENPDVLIYGMGLYNDHMKYKNCVKFFYTHEAIPTNKNVNSNAMLFYNQAQKRFINSINDSDYIISVYDHNNEKNLKMPAYLLYAYQMIIDKRLQNFDFLIKNRNFTKEDIKNRKFCCFLHRNRPQSIQDRSKMESDWHNTMIDFYNIQKNLHNYQKSFEEFNKDGIYKNRFLFMLKLNDRLNVEKCNIPGWSYEKCLYIKKFKFTFAFENSSTYIQYPLSSDSVFLGNHGSATEKIIEPLISGTIPLYWGNTNVHNEINLECFINWYDFRDDDKMIDKILEINNNDDQYLYMLNQPIIKDLNKSYFNLDRYLSFFEKIIG